MKPHLASFLCGAALTACAVPVISTLHAQTVTVTPAQAQVQVQYKILAGGPAPDGKTMEDELNRLAAQGWRVRTSVMAGVILEKE
ncbi:MAG: hypothetical protein EOP86_09275 [Verrucomicrobiaceae bacterium]|nr:MAG: hypothetical protein EOP86_09275 [Verrucomicrobiaceae bacterium]